jgi:hypothetical protein
MSPETLRGRTSNLRQRHIITGEATCVPRERAAGRTGPAGGVYGVGDTPAERPVETVTRTRCQALFM